MRERFSAEEWADLCAAPFVAAMYVATAEGNQVDYTQEMVTLLQILRSSVPAGGGLARAVMSEFGTRRGNRLGTGAAAISRADRVALLAHMQRAGVALARAGGEEAALFRAWVLDLARQTAAASRTGGLFGIGGVAISEPEAVALAALAAALTAPEV